MNTSGKALKKKRKVYLNCFKEKYKNCFLITTRNLSYGNNLLLQLQTQKKEIFSKGVGPEKNEAKN